MYDYLKHVTMDSFGGELPDNWEAAAAVMNERIDALPDGLDDVEKHEAHCKIWEAYCRGEYDEEIAAR